MHVDFSGLESVGVSSDTPITISVDGIQFKSALNLMLEPLSLGYMIKDEVLQVTSKERQQGELVTRSYPVADLVIPIPNFSTPDPFGAATGNPISGLKP